MQSLLWNRLTSRMMIRLECPCGMAYSGSMSNPCPFGDPLCPCQDGDACHYTGEQPMPLPKAYRQFKATLLYMLKQDVEVARVIARRCADVMDARKGRV